jgi:hypothetical protein
MDLTESLISRQDLRGLAQALAVDNERGGVMSAA